MFINFLFNLFVSPVLHALHVTTNNVKRRRFIRSDNRNGITFLFYLLKGNTGSTVGKMRANRGIHTEITKSKIDDVVERCQMRERVSVTVGDRFQAQDYRDGKGFILCNGAGLTVTYLFIMNARVSILREI